MSVSFLIHMGAALIKLSVSAIHATGCLAPKQQKKKKKESVGVQVIWQTQQGELCARVCINVTESEAGEGGE